MAPNLLEPTGVLYEDDNCINTENALSKHKSKPQKVQIIWRIVFLFVYFYIAAVYGLYLAVTSAKYQTNLFALLFLQFSIFGVTAGAHRLWSHRSYKTKWPLTLFLTFCNTVAFQDSIIHWARDHRVHHKFTETDADPQNATRGFFFAHVGWLLCKKHPDVKLKGDQIDMSDLYNDPILRFQKKYYLLLSLICALIIPIFVPWYFWNETISNAWFVNFLRFGINLNNTFLINSAAHSPGWGKKPYDKFFSAVELNFMYIMTSGECYHNYHHTFPWDYKAAELGANTHNITTAFIDFCSKLGIAYDLKTVTIEMVKQRVLRTGDGSHELWGWGDVDQSQQERDAAVIIGKKYN